MAQTDVAEFPRGARFSLDQDEWEKIAIEPWLTYKVPLPPRPLPPVSARPHIRTKRLIVRPILPSDLDGFYELRRIRETQDQSTSRGRPDRDLDETRKNIARLQAPYDARHWYFGAFSISTGELIGEGGIPDAFSVSTEELIGEGGLPDTEHQPVSGWISGWTRCEVLIKPAFWRQGYGTELFKAVLDSWWDLPRELRKHQLLPSAIDNPPPGSLVRDRLEMIWEADNDAASHFFPKALSQVPVAHEGFFTSLDWREGREGNLVRWAGTMIQNPRAVQCDDPSDDSTGDSE